MMLGGWPFLVSRNPYLDYRTILAPDFLVQARATNLLARVTEGDLTPSGVARLREVKDPTIGNFWVIFRVVKATQADLGTGNKQEILRDYFGREIYFLEGLTCQDFSANINIGESIFKEIHALVLSYYQQFWPLTEPSNAYISPRKQFALHRAQGELLTLETLPVFIPPSRQTGFPIFSHQYTWHTGAKVSGLAFSGDGLMLLSRLEKQTVRAWSLEAQNYEDIWQGNNCPPFPSQIRASLRGNAWATGCYQEQRNYIWLSEGNGGEGKKLFERGRWEPDLTMGSLVCLDFSGDGQFLAAGTKQGRLILWQLSNFQKTVVSEQLSGVQALAFRGNSYCLLSGESSGEVKRWSISPPLSYPCFTRFPFPVQDLAFSRDGEELLIAGDCLWQLWHFETGKQIFTHQQPSPIGAIAFSREGEYLAIGEVSGRVSYWQRATLREIGHYFHSASISALTFSPREGLLASSSQDGEIRLLKTQ